MKSSVLLCVGLVAAVCGVVRAEEREGPPREMAHILKRADRGEPLDPHALNLIDRFAKDYLFRVECNVLEDSRFSLAQLQAKTGKGEQAIETLQKLAAATKNEDVRSAAMYDIGRVYETSLRDADNAAGVYAKVTGRFRAMAQRALLILYERTGHVDKAIALLKDGAGKTKDKGEKLALLRRLGEVAKRTGKDEIALAAYRQISDEYTEKDIAEIKAAAAKRVSDTFAKVMELQEGGRGREAEQMLRKLRGWAGQLIIAGRMDEFRAVREAHERNERRMEERHDREEEEDEGGDEHEGAEDDGG